MPLFLATVVVSHTVTIVVNAPNKRTAGAYMRRTDEWKDDSGFEQSESPSFRVADVTPVTHPSQVPSYIDSDCPCWGYPAFDGYEEVQLADALYDDKLRTFYEPVLTAEKVDDYDAADAAFADYIAERDKLRESFANARAVTDANASPDHTTCPHKP